MVKIIFFKKFVYLSPQIGFITAKTVKSKLGRPKTTCTIYIWIKEYLNHSGSFFLVCTQISMKKKQKTLKNTLISSLQIFLIDQKSHC